MGLFVLPSVLASVGKRRLFAGVLLAIAITGLLQQYFAGKSLSERTKAARGFAATNAAVR
jgi:hypothetical protein